jgi:iron complex outermembrane recepter protein
MRLSGFFLGLSAVLMSVTMGVPPAQAEGRLRLDLPAASLSDTLTAMGDKAGVNIVFASDIVAGKRSVTLKGKYTLASALNAVLAGTGLAYVQTASNTYIIEFKGAVDPKPLPPVSSETLAFGIEAYEAVVPPQIVVKGLRNSIDPAQEAKKTAFGAIDSLAANATTRQADANAADAVQRISGVAIARDQGEGRTISVRGLSPEFIRTEINGVEAQASTDGIALGANRGRNFDFNVFPSELFSRIDVKKTSTADQPEGSLGATISLTTPHPFDRAGPRSEGSVQSSYNDLSTKAGSRATALFSNTFNGDRLGVLVSLSYTYTPFEVQGVSSGWWNQGTANGGFCQPTAGTGGICDVPASDLAPSLEAYARANQATTYFPQFYRYANLIGNVRRFGAVVSGQWRPSIRTLVTADLLYSRFETRRNDYYIEAIGFSRTASQGGKPETVPRRVELDANNAMVYGVFDNVDVRSEMGIDNFTTEFVQGALRLKHDFSERLTFEGVLGASRSWFDNSLDIIVQMDRFNVDGYAFDVRENGMARPALTYPFDVNDPASWYFGPRVTQPGGTGAAGPEVRLRPSYVENGYDNAQAKMTFRMSPRFELVTGIDAKRYSYRSALYAYEQGEANFPGPASGLSGLTRQFCGADKVVPPPGTPRCWLVPDVGAFISAYDLLSNQGRASLSPTTVGVRGSNQAVTEDDIATFAQIHFRASVRGLPLRGDAGIRYIETDQSSLFFANVPLSTHPDGYVWTRVERSYNEALPSFNLVLEPDETTILRFSAAKVMARPPLSTIAAATSVAVNGGIRQVTFGNPSLKPFRAINYDMAYEWYPKSGGLVSLGIFYKDISTYIQNLTRTAPFSSLGLPETLLANTGVAASDDFTILTAVNTPGGPLRGLEVNIQKQFKFLPGPWAGLGAVLSYTYADSAIKYSTATSAGPQTVEADLINLSKNSYTISLFYKGRKLQAHVTQKYRSEYLLSVPGIFNTDMGGADATRYWDASVSYSLRPGVVASFGGSNLSNAREATWNRASAHLPADYRLSGRQFYLGLRYSN